MSIRNLLREKILLHLFSSVYLTLNEYILGNEGFYKSTLLDKILRLSASIINHHLSLIVNSFSNISRDNRQDTVGHSVYAHTHTRVCMHTYNSVQLENSI